jgi:hypothetical protein
MESLGRSHSIRDSVGNSCILELGGLVPRDSSYASEMMKSSTHSGVKDLVLVSYKKYSFNNTKSAIS